MEAAKTELYSGGYGAESSWNSVNYWNISEARVVCRQLGYNNGKGESKFQCI